MTKNMWAAGLALVTASAACAQTAAVPVAAPPAFDVASVKASQPSQGRDGGGRGGGGRGNIQLSPDTLTMRNTSLKNAIRWAYHVTEYQVSGPDWLDSAHFNIVGKSAGPASEEQLQLMMQTLLVDRFKLVLHHQTKEFQVYVLAPGKNGTKLQESKSEGESSIEPQQGRGGGGLNAMGAVSVQRTPISQMIDMLSPVLGAPVIDMTGLKGRYDVTVNLAKYAGEMQPGAGGAPPDPLSLITMALEGELGLKLESRKMPLDQLVIDHAEKTPTEN
jgi:uncharacterized protein (TIGR03435 family)